MMSRQGKQLLTVVVPEGVMAELEQWSASSGVPIDQAVICALTLMTHLPTGESWVGAMGGEVGRGDAYS